MRKIYVIYSTGRTGSILIKNILSNDDSPGGLLNCISFFYPHEFEKILKYDNDMVVHTHEKDFFKNFKFSKDEIILIKSMRENEFERIMSYFIAKHTNEWSEYSNKNVSFYLPENEFLCYIKKNNSEKFYDLSEYNFKKIYNIYYERLVNEGINYIANSLNLKINSNDINLNLKKKSPYYFKNVITNWEKLYLLYNEKIYL